MSVVGGLLYAVVLGGHTPLAAATARLLRIRMKTRGGRMLYTSLTAPSLLLVSTFLIGQALPPLGVTTRLVVLALLVGVPVALGFSIDPLCVPAPDEYDLPETRDG